MRPFDTDRVSSLSVEKRKLLEKRLRRTTANASKRSSAIPKKPSDSKPLASLGQARIWLLAELDNNSPSHNMISSFRLAGSIDASRLQQAFDRILERHEILRSVYRLEDGELRQTINPPESLPIRFAQRETDEERLQLTEELCREPLDLKTGPLLRLGLFSTPDNSSHILALSMHDMICDKWSQMIFWQELSALYHQAEETGDPTLPELPIQYSDFAYWQRANLDRPREDKLRAFWQKKLEDPPDPIPLPTDRPYPSKITEKGSLAFAKVSSKTTRKLRSLSAEHETSLFSILMLGYAILLKRYAQVDDLLVATPVANRQLQETANLIGFFLNTLPLRFRFDGDETVSEAIAQIKEDTREALAHQDLPTDKIAESIKFERVSGRHPLFQTMFVFQSETERSARPEFPGCVATPFYVETKTAKFDLTLFAAENGDRIETIAEYRSDLFDAKTIERLLGHYANILDQLARKSAHRISEIHLLTRQELSTLAEFENGPPLNVDLNSSVLDLFQQHAKSASIAVASTEGGYSYQELDYKSDQIAFQLIRNGARPDQPIAVLAERTPDTILAILSILKSGAPYLAVDPQTPTERIEYLLSDANCDLVIAPNANRPHPSIKRTRVASVDALLEKAPRHNSNSLPAISSDDLAYVIYTSGSTGQPKGVAVTHRNLLSSTASRIAYYPQSPERFLLLPSFAFDSSIAGIFWMLCTGGTLFIANHDQSRDPEAISELVRSNQIQSTLCVPTLYNQLLSWDHRQLESLKTVIVAGETCPGFLVAQHYSKLPNCPFYNEYGPSEATVWASVYPVSRESTHLVPIGRPIPGTEIRVLDQERNRLPVGQTGELYIGGPGLARGYLNKPDQTAARFVRLNDGTRLYASGDLARWNEKGLLEYLGRNDDQVKIHGHRIELGEIESCLSSLPEIEEAAVVAQEPTNPSIEELIHLLPTEQVESILREIEATSPLPTPTDLTRKLRRKDFSVRFDFEDVRFINPPRKAQRDWLLGQAINEIADDLQHLHHVASSFVSGKDHNLRKDLVDISDAALSESEIMEDWQTPLMKVMAEYVTEKQGQVLEIGFGRGVSAEFIQNSQPATHTIIEMNRHCIDKHFKPWRRRHPDASIEMRHGRWQDVLPGLGQFDAILFHTYPMNEEEFIEYILNSVTFAEHAFADMANHLRPGGVFTYLTAEIDSLSRRHQRALLGHFSEISFKVIPVSPPHDTIDSWWAKSMVAVKAIK